MDTLALFSCYRVYLNNPLSMLQYLPNGNATAETKGPLSLGIHHTKRLEGKHIGISEHRACPTLLVSGFKMG